MHAMNIWYLYNDSYVERKSPLGRSSTYTKSVFVVIFHKYLFHSPPTTTTTIL